MSVHALSQDAVVPARPRFSIDGEIVTALGEDLVRLEVSADENGFSRLEAAFLNWDRLEADGAVDFVHDVSDKVDFGRSISVLAGGADNAASIFDGRITAIEGCFPQGRAPETIIRAEDALFWFGLGQRTRLHEEATDSSIASSVLTASGDSSEADTEGPSHRAMWQINQNDLAFLLERARSVDAALVVEDGSVHFRPRRPAPGEPIALTRHGSLMRFQACADLVHQRAEVRVHGYSVPDKGGIHETAGSEDAIAEADGGTRTGPEILADVHPEAIEHLHAEMPVTAEEASRLAGARMRARARSFVRATGTTNGTPGMSVGSRINVVDVGPRFSGIYTVVKVRHSFDQSNGYRTHFGAERAAVGGGA